MATSKINHNQARLKHDGWCILEDIIPKEHTISICEKVLKIFKSKKYGEGTNVNYPNYLAYDQSLAPYLSNKRVLNIVETIFGPGVRITSTRPVILDPGGKSNQRSWHADCPFNQARAACIPSPYPDVTVHLTTIFMLTKFTRKNGGTWIVPGSH